MSKKTPPCSTGGADVASDAERQLCVTLRAFCMLGSPPGLKTR